MLSSKASKHQQNDCLTSAYSDLNYLSGEMICDDVRHSARSGQVLSRDERLTENIPGRIKSIENVVS